MLLALRVSLAKARIMHFIKLELSNPWAVVDVVVDAVGVVVVVIVAVLVNIIIIIILEQYNSILFYR